MDISQELLTKIKELFDQNWGARRISKELGISRWAVQQAYKLLGVYNIGRKTPKGRPSELTGTKICRECQQDKDISQFRGHQHKNGSIYYEALCNDCENKVRNVENRQRYQENRQWHIDYHKKNKKKRNQQNKKYREKNKELLKQKRQLTKESDRKGSMNGKETKEPPILLLN